MLRLYEIELAEKSNCYHTCFMNKNDICYPYVVGGLEAVLQHMMLLSIPGVKITDEAAYRAAIDEKIASIKESSKEYN